MKYKALRDSFDSKRAPKFCVGGRVYEFDSDPGKHFKCLEKPVDEKQEIIEEAEELGVEIDKRKSAKNMRAELEKAKQQAELTSYGD